MKERRKQAYQEWKQKKIEAERAKKYKERKEMQQRRQAEREVIRICVHELDSLNRTFCRGYQLYSRNKRIVLPVGPMKKKESEKKKAILEEAMKHLTIEKRSGEKITCRRGL